MRQKRVAAVHDISCFGKCSLTVALPILSAAGIETSVIPTAVLSTHTGGFTEYTFRDLTQDILPISRHWKSLAIDFDALYTGYLGSYEQLEIVSQFFDDFGKKDNIIFVDPVMADNGKLYSSFSADFPEGMRKLCRKADIITPNLTEAALLLDAPYNPGPYTKEYIENILRSLSDLGPGQVVITGVSFGVNQLGAAVYDKKSDQISYAFANRVDGYYHGTGDVFASAFLSAMLNGFDLPDCARIAVEFTAESINRTRQADTDLRYGVNFENSIPNLIRHLKLM
ncbi:MAG TPA: pyridoxamine kinase [Ruminococcaceae bacterium]|nr:pyridoxamine kinase [Oscillospiraceae bacterium]HCA31121.1 pyridoxamine kinase [Oscillospiraceae bacterium]